MDDAQHGRNVFLTHWTDLLISANTLRTLHTPQIVTARNKSGDNLPNAASVAFSPFSAPVGGRLAR